MYYIILYHIIYSILYSIIYYIILYHIIYSILYSIIYYMILYYIILYYIILYYIIIYYNISYFIILYYIILYCIILYYYIIYYILYYIIDIRTYITFDEPVVFQVVFALVGFSYVVGSITGSLGQLRSMSEHTVKDRRARIVTAEEVLRCDSNYRLQKHCPDTDSLP